MSARRALLGSLVWALVCASACRTAAGPFPPPLEPASASLAGDDIYNLQLTPEQLRADGASDALLGRISASAFRYFRAVAEPFKHRTCEAFRDLRWRLPSGAVHGDAHLEQFVVTDEGFGLADFDNAGYGPAIVDLVRYAASLHLSCREIEGGCDPERAVNEYFNAYRAALDHPVQREPPPIVARLRAGVGPEPEAWLEWAEGLMQPLPREEEEQDHPEEAAEAAGIEEPDHAQECGDLHDEHPEADPRPAIAVRNPAGRRARRPASRAR